MLRYLLVVGVLACLVGCQQPTEIIIPQTDNDKAATDTTRIEFAVFGKMKDKFKEKLGGRRGGDEGADCTGPNCPAPQQPNLRPSDDGEDLALIAAPLGIAFCVLLGLASFIGVRAVAER